MTARSYYERKHNRVGRCPLCGAQAAIAQVTWDGTDRTRYHAKCTRKSCPNHRVPFFEDCFETEAEAARAWNSLAERRRGQFVESAQNGGLEGIWKPQRGKER